MARVNRVMDLLELLKANDARTVQELADSLGVSRRTVLRDLATLRDRGWPIRADSGPGGGVLLEKDRGVATVHLKVEELVALWVASQLSASVSTLPWSALARSALDKLISSVPKERGRSLRELTRRIVVGRPATARVQAELGRPSPELLTAFEQGFTQNRCLQFAYVDRQGRPSNRIAEPHGLLVEPPAWYLLARDRQSGEPRMFRMDRIRKPAVRMDLPFQPDFEGLRADRDRRG